MHRRPSGAKDGADALPLCRYQWVHPGGFRPNGGDEPRRSPVVDVTSLEVLRERRTHRSHSTHWSHTTPSWTCLPSPVLDRVRGRNPLPHGRGRHAQTPQPDPDRVVPRLRPRHDRPGLVRRLLRPLRHGFIPITKAQPDPALLWANLPLVLLLAAFSFHVTGQYAIHRLRRLREEVVGVLKGVTLLALLVLAATFFRHDPYESRARHGPVLGGGLRPGAERPPSRLGRRPHPAQPRLQPDLSRSSSASAASPARPPVPCARPAGWASRTSASSRTAPARSPATSTCSAASPTCRSSFQKYSIGHVFIALPLNRYDDARRVFDVLSQSLVEVRLVADVPNLAGLSLTTTNLDGLPVVGLRESPHFGLNVVFKRVMDMLLSLIGLLAAVAAAAADRRAGETDQPRPDVLPPGALRPQRPVVPHAEVPQHGRRRRAADAAPSGRSRTTTGAPGSAPSCAAPASTSCRSCSTC